MVSVCIVGYAEDTMEYAETLARMDSLGCIYDRDASKKEIAEKYGVEYYTELEYLDSIDGFVVSGKELDWFIESVMNKRKRRKDYTYILLPRHINNCSILRDIPRDSMIRIMPSYLDYFNPLLDYTRDMLRDHRPLLFKYNSTHYSIERIADDASTLTYLIGEQPRYVSSMRNGPLMITLLAYRECIAEITARIGGSITTRRLDILCKDDISISVDHIKQEVSIDGSVKKSGSEDLLCRLLYDFVSSIERGESPRVTLKDALVVWRVMDAIMLSSRLGSQIYIGNDVMKV
jgi:hypothetical protein